MYRTILIDKCFLNAYWVKGIIQWDLDIKIHTLNGLLFQKLIKCKAMSQVLVKIKSHSVILSPSM